MPKPTHFGEAVKARREKLGLTRYQLAKDAGITQTHLQQIEDGERPGVSLNVAGKIADALAVKVDELRPNHR